MSERRGWGEVGLAGVVAAIIGMMVVPLPRLALDLLIALSLTSAIVVVLVAVYTRSAARLTSLPAVLLVSTLFRLGVNVSTTRRILTEGDGGAVVAGFGTLVAGADVVVGLVMFAIITLVQVLVVTRGAERVAEVAARFALDSLPGKQLAIDAELRAGGIDGDEARRQRAELERRSQLYAAFDGAMKFVRGDAFAAIAIVVINLVAGFAIGTLERGLDARTALATYAILSIGDGLVVQLPALLTALAAALVVVRVGEHDGDHAIGHDIAAQLGAEPRAFWTAGALLMALGWAPGLPGIPFWTLGAAAGALGWWLQMRRRRRPETILAISRAPAGIDEGIELAIAPSVAASLQGMAWVEDALERARNRMFTELGVRAPAVRVRADDGVAAHEIELRLYGVVVDWLPWDPGDPQRALPAQLDDAFARYAADMVRASAIQAELDALGVGHASLVREVVPKIASVPVLVEVVRRLVRERVSVRDLGAVLQGLAQTPPGAPRDAGALAEIARAHLQAVVTGAVAPRGTLSAWTLDPLIEEAIRGAILQRDGGATVALEPALARDIVAAVKKSVGGSGVVLASGDVRRHLRAVLAPEAPEVVVVAPHELRPQVVVHPLGRIGVE